VRIAVEHDFRTDVLLRLQEADQLGTGFEMLRDDLEDPWRGAQRIELIDEVADVLEGMGSDVVDGDDKPLGLRFS
jgi:hypothetical protein